MDIDVPNFADDCVNDGFFIGVNPHFLMAVAMALSGIKNDRDGDRIGPFRIKKIDWDVDANRTDSALQIALDPDDIDIPMMQITYAALQTLRAQEFLRLTLTRYPSVAELYEVWPKTPVIADTALQKALDDTRDPLQAAVERALKGLADGAVNGINLANVPAGRQAIASLIVSAFSAAGYGLVQQIAAVANAIAESNLNPLARFSTASEDSVGLFQLNMKGGVGTGHAVEDLLDPVKNTALIIAEANKVAAFKAATTLKVAVELFVTKIERPANQPGEIIKRLAIAHRLVA